MKYSELSDEVKMDCQIVRAKEMHNWFVCMRVFGLSKEQFLERLTAIRFDKAYMEKIAAYNKLWKSENEARKAVIQSACRKDMDQGVRFNATKLVLAGFDMDFVRAFAVS